MLSCKMLILCILALRVSLAQNSTLCSNGISIRKEYRDLSKEEWNGFLATMMKMQDMPSKDHGNYTEWDRMTSLHIKYGHHFHGYYLHPRILFIL